MMAAVVLRGTCAGARVSRPGQNSSATRRARPAPVRGSCASRVAAHFPRHLESVEGPRGGDRMPPRDHSHPDCPHPRHEARRQVGAVWSRIWLLFALAPARCLRKGVCGGPRRRSGPRANPLVRSGPGAWAQFLVRARVHRVVADEPDYPNGLVGLSDIVLPLANVVPAAGSVDAT